MEGDITAIMGMVILQVCYAGLSITSKLAMQSGMNPLVLLTYRQFFGTLAIAPFAFFTERKTRPKITFPVLVQIFICSLSGQESVRIKTKPGLAKVMGTIVCICGAMLLSFYHGHTIGLGESKIHWPYVERIMSKTNPTNRQENRTLGSVLLLCSSFSWALWFVIQARLSVKFKAPYTSTTLLCFMAFFQCGLIAVISEHNVASWSLKSPIRLISALYTGIVCSGLTFSITSWIIQRKGPLYVSIFTPLLLIIVAIFSWALLHEQLYVGTVLGSILIIIGLYGVLWGKSKEMKVEEEDKVEKATNGSQKDDVELQMK
ncbi:WAT1-related protein At1g09380 isoform X2 [Cucurbita pepo subsp. pepo]|uniref:WAT1-related protein At1g09380 isoform X2 n=1 Tax=Cucurbita pepo subsp. pepo TaxID=3664 RepID=UPI000C9D9533|nr:WAT1-related protein At1g09380 isoform X2 [Cucurbita pepo subsp. pepo]